MAAVVSILRVTTRTRAVWRECAACFVLVALPPGQTCCEACTAPRATPVRRRAA